MLFLGYRGGGQWDWNLAYNKDYDYPKRAVVGSGILNTGTSYINNPSSYWNNLKVSVDGNNAKAYVNGHFVAEKDISGLDNTTRVGLFGGIYEVTPVDFRFRYFKVTQNVACVP